MLQLTDSATPAAEISARGGRELCGVNEAARRLKAKGHALASSTISRQLGKSITNHGTPAKPLVDVAEIIATRGTRLDPMKRPIEKLQAETPASDTAPRGSLVDSRSRKIDAEARAAEIKAQQLEGTLVDRGTFERATKEQFMALRDRLLQLPGAVAEKLVTLRSEREIVAFLEDELTKLLSAVAEEWEQQNAGAQPDELASVA